jgi:hypothetical protein
MRCCGGVGKAWRGRNASLLLGLVLLAALVTSVASFARRTQPTFVPGSVPLPGVVFTGQFNRVHAGLALLERGAIGPLLVSGTNPPAGIPLAGFAQQFRRKYSGTPHQGRCSSRHSLPGAHVLGHQGGCGLLGQPGTHRLL